MALNVGFRSLGTEFTIARAMPFVANNAWCSCIPTDQADTEVFATAKSGMRRSSASSESVIVGN